jgi:hypothetical protein
MRGKTLVDNRRSLCQEQNQVEQPAETVNTILSLRPTVWHETANHGDQWQQMQHTFAHRGKTYVAFALVSLMLSRTNRSNSASMCTSCGLQDSLATSYRKFGHAVEKASTGSISCTSSFDIWQTLITIISLVLMLIRPDKPVYSLVSSVTKLSVGSGQTFE